MEALRALLRLGADISACDMEGETPLDLAKTAAARSAHSHYNSIMLCGCLFQLLTSRTVLSSCM